MSHSTYGSTWFRDFCADSNSFTIVVRLAGSIGWLANVETPSRTNASVALPRALAVSLRSTAFSCVLCKSYNSVILHQKHTHIGGPLSNFSTLTSVFPTFPVTPAWAMRQSMLRFCADVNRQFTCSSSSSWKHTRSPWNRTSSLWNRTRWDAGRQKCQCSSNNAKEKTSHFDVISAEIEYVCKRDQL